MTLIPIEDRHAGRSSREHLMPADARILCQEPVNREKFDLMFDVRFAEPAKGDNARKRRRRITAEAIAVCKACPVRETCLDVNGRDLELGVVGGFTDAQRAKFYSETA